MKSNSAILNAVMSRLASERESLLVHLNIVLNNNTVTNPSTVVEETAELFKTLSVLEASIETIGIIIEKNTATGQEKSNEINNLTNAIKEQLNEQKTVENNGNHP